MVNVVFNLNFKSSTQDRYARSNRPEGSEVQKAIGQAVSYSITDIAFRATAAQSRKIQNQIESKIAGITQKELSNMGQKINKLGIGLSNAQRFPLGGSLNVEGGTASSLSPDRKASMVIRDVTGDWRDRTQSYLRRKSKKFGHRRWWLNTGELRDVLKNPQTYTGAYGPVRVRWIPTGTEQLTSAFNKRYSTFGRTTGYTYSFTTGNIEMSILGKITPSMLAEPGKRALNSKFSGLFDMFDAKSETKLLGRFGPRVLVEPFLTFYINRQIPNAIMRTIEASFKIAGR